MYYLWLVLPFEELLEAILQQRVTVSSQMWPADYDGRVWTPARMRQTLSQETRAWLSVELGIQSYPQLRIPLDSARKMEKRQEVPVTGPSTP